ncbi:MAG: T9SS type A sorting domain-containing protein, partial [Calditrichaeota bacterium]|nr:T9SS type A sorting domain-containing protein [Calditrichota bacterium]
SLEFQRYLATLTGDHLPRRDPSIESMPYEGFYFAAVREECLPYAIPLLEWKRRMGYRVEVTAFRASDSLAANIRGLILERYLELRRAGRAPFDYVLLIGDRRGFEHAGLWTLPSFQGNPSMAQTARHADYEYGLLEGNDFLMDVGVGRIAAGSQARMEHAVGKLFAYERAPDTRNPNWFTRAGVFSQRWADEFDPSLYLTTRWGERVLEAAGYRNLLVREPARADSADADLIASELRGWLNERPPALMIGRAQISPWEASLPGVDPNRVHPIVVNFGGHAEFMMNSLYNSGNRDELVGAASVFSGWGTPQTFISNALWASLVRSLVIDDLSLGWTRAAAGPGLVRLVPRYPTVLTLYQTDLDFYGDPGLKPWRSVPRQLRVTHPETLSPGTSLVEVRVLFAGDDQPAADIQVAIYAPGDVPDPDEYDIWEPLYQRVGWTDDDGYARITLDPTLPEGPIYVTVTGRGLYPSETEISIEERPIALVAIDYDVTGALVPNGDAEIQPTLENRGSDVTARGVFALLEASSPYAIASPETLSFGDIPAGESRRARGSARVTFTGDVPDGADPGVRLRIYSQDGEWSAAVPLDVQASNVVAGRIEPGTLLTDSTGNVLVNLVNNGRWPSGPIAAQIRSESWAVEVLDGIASYASILPEGGTRRPLDGPFQLRPNRLAPPGMEVMLYLDLRQEILLKTIPLRFRLGNAREATPYGPDDYGYIALNDGEEARWTGAPLFGYINPPRVDSTRLPIDALTDPGAATALRLPFTLRFYGQEFDTITVCTHGFIAVGNQVRNMNFQNFPLDFAAAGAMGMIAPYWDRFTRNRNDNQPGIFAHYDQAGRYIVIEWYRIRATEDVNDQTFQAVLFDPSRYPTASGDSPILFQYSTVRLIAGDDSTYASTGISSPDGRTGLTYTFSDLYRPQNPRFTEGNTNRSILFTTGPGAPVGSLQGRVVEAANPNRPVLGAVVSGYAYGLGAIFGLPVGEEGYQGSALPIGHYTLRAGKPGYNSVERAIRIEPGGNRSADFSLERVTLELDRREFRESFFPGHRAYRTYRVANRGDGVLSLQLAKVEVEGADWLRISASLTVGPGETVVDSFQIRNTARIPYNRNGMVILRSDRAQLADTIRVILNIDSANAAPPPDLPVAGHYALHPAAPNPFNGRTTVRFNLPEESDVKLTLYDLEGRILETLEMKRLFRGKHSRTIELEHLPAGLYFCRMEAKAFRATTRLVLLK